MSALAATGAAADGHLLTVTLEDYYHVKAFNRLIHSGQWYRFENRLERNTELALSLLDQTGARATFFVFGQLAETMPELVRRIVERGHEVGSRGMYPRDMAQLTPDEIRADLVRSREELERAAGRRIVGFRAGEVWNDPADLWMLELVAAEGYGYDSSYCPWMRLGRDRPDLLVTHRRRAGERDLWVVPISSFSTLGWRLPLGGNFLRQFPRPFVHHELRRWTARAGAPLVTYFNVWELDPDQPRIAAAPLLQRVRQYRNLDRMYALLYDMLSTYRFTTIAEGLGFGAEIGPELGAAAGARTPVARTPLPWRTTPRTPLPARASPVTPVTVVVPCFNEAHGLQYLRNTLASVERTLASRYELRFIFVDDCSTDATYEGLQHVFGDHPRARVLRHETNAGVAAAIMTGLRAADTEIACSIDADCTYDPHELAAMIPLLEQGADLVTASPYHPRGHVRNVPAWRLGLSKGLSGLYRQILHNRLHTYTACFRVYRRSRAIGVELTRRGFLGVMEHLGRLDLGGARIAEHPTTLDVRMLGRSKMKVVRTIAGHLGLY
ncbi:MAG TPA: glycosyltransferase, partial [Gemmatimonadales bacterium]|nr:glycosyltransferase [Gemmatimonadales bacterium]